MSARSAHYLARDPARPHRNNRSGRLHVHQEGRGWRAKQIIDGQRIEAGSHATIEEALHALRQARYDAGVT